MPIFSAVLKKKSVFWEAIDKNKGDCYQFRMIRFLKIYLSWRDPSGGLTDRDVANRCNGYVIIIIIIIIINNCNLVVTRWQWLFCMYTKYEIGY